MFCHSRVLTGFALLVGANVAIADDSNLREQMDKMVAEIPAVLTQQGVEGVQIGRIDGPYHTPTGYGSSLRQALKVSLDNATIPVQHQSKVILDGKFAEIKNSAGAVTGVRVTLHLHDVEDNILHTLTPVVLNGPEYVSHAFGVTTTLLVAPQPATTPAEAIHEPNFHQKGNQVFASEKELFGVELLLWKKSDYTPLAPKNEQGWAFVGLKPGDIYGIRVINNSDYDAVVDLRIDGLTLFHFSQDRKPDGSPRYSQLCVPAKTSQVIRGWHHTNEKSFEFLTETYFVGVGAKVQPNDPVGVISASFALAWKKDENPPKDETVRSREAMHTRPGASVDSHYQEVVRILGQQRASVAIRYSRDN